MNRRTFFRALPGLALILPQQQEKSPQSYTGPVAVNEDSPRVVIPCHHPETKFGGFYLLYMKNGEGPDDSEYGKSHLGVEHCTNCGTLMLPEEWRRRK